MKLIRTDKIKHQYDVWKGDEKFKRTALDGVDLDVMRGSSGRYGLKLEWCSRIPTTRS